MCRGGYNNWPTADDATPRRRSPLAADAQSSYPLHLCCRFFRQLTHNFIDATNLADAIADATHSLRTDLLPMVAALKPKKVLRTLVKSLHVSKERLICTLLELPELLGQEQLDAVLDAASAPEADGAARDAVRELLEAHLAESLPAVRGPFAEIASELCEALGLEASGESDRR
jgi:hypothetical protein